MAKNTLTIDLSVESVKDAIKQMELYRNSFSIALTRAITFLHDGAKDFLERMVIIEQDPDKQRITVTSEEPENGLFGFTLSINGEGVGFLEFGAGAFVDEDHEYVGRAPFAVFPGSWSDEHQRTWQAYITTGAFADKNGEYLYNRYPVRPLYETAQWILNNAEGYIRREISSLGFR